MTPNAVASTKSRVLVLENPGLLPFRLDYLVKVGIDNGIPPIRERDDLTQDFRLRRAAARLKAPARPSFRETWNENWRVSTPRMKWPESKLDSRLGNSAIEEFRAVSSSAIPPGTLIDSRFIRICARVW